ncbi:MAG: hypothetical protein VX255_15180 [Candidatus Latescibacterota bacterium]|nr:hypothetical protein [Candidatus Latescibacterota bacterium]
MARRLACHGLISPVDDEEGYVELFRSLQPVPPMANSYPGSPPRLNDRQQAVLRAFEVSGPLSPRKLREHSGLDYRPLMAAVNRLEEAFLVCEDQTDDSWDRPLHLFAREWPDAQTEDTDPFEAKAQVLLQWALTYHHVTAEQAASITGWPKRQLASLLSALHERGEFQILETSPVSYRIGGTQRAHIGGVREEERFVELGSEPRVT